MNMRSDVVEAIAEAIVETMIKFNDIHSSEGFAALQLATASWVETMDLKPSTQMAIITELAPAFEEIARRRQARKKQAEALTKGQGEAGLN